MKVINAPRATRIRPPTKFFVKLEALADEVAESLILIRRVCFAGIGQQLNDDVLASAGHVRDRTDRVSIFATRRQAEARVCYRAWTNSSDNRQRDSRTVIGLPSASRRHRKRGAAQCRSAQCSCGTPVSQIAAWTQVRSGGPPRRFSVQATQRNFGVTRAFDISLPHTAGRAFIVPCRSGLCG